MNYENSLNPSAVRMKPSGIRKFFDILDTIEGAISLTIGEPDFVTPWSIREEGIYSLEKGRTHYTSNAGLTELRNEISLYLDRRFGQTYDSITEILVTVGGSEGIDAALRTIVSPGDEVIIHEPSFVCYKPLIELAGGIPVVLETKAENEFKVTPEELSALITPKTKLLILSYPNNPTGAIMEKADLEKLAAIIRKTNMYIISDEIYAELTYNNAGHFSISTLPDMRERTVVINGFSKAFAMTGWRLGYVAAPAEIMKHMKKIHQYAIMCSPTTSQYAAVEALKNCMGSVHEMVDEYNRRRRLIVNAFRELGFPCFEPYGGFYIFPDIRKYSSVSEEFCSELLAKYKVALVPGTAFGKSGEGFVRVSYAYSVKNITEAINRIRKFTEEFKR